MSAKSTSQGITSLGEIVLHENLVTRLLEEIRRVVESAVRCEIEKLRHEIELHHTTQKTAEPQQSPAASAGVALTPADKVMAADLRTAFLLGKLPEDAGLLMDTKTTARLLNVSPRMVYRLDQVQAMPAPVRLGTLVRFRVAEIIEWVDSDCPPRKYWTYSGKGPTKQKR
jgi:predicted DNA-binding transcriptional regulator AlpA